MGVPRAFSGVTGPADEAPRRLEVSRLDRFREIDEDLLEVRGVGPQIPQILRVDLEARERVPDRLEAGRLPHRVMGVLRQRPDPAVLFCRQRLAGVVEDRLGAAHVDSLPALPRGFAGGLPQAHVGDRIPSRLLQAAAGPLGQDGDVGVHAPSERVPRLGQHLAGLGDVHAVPTSGLDVRRGAVQDCLRARVLALRVRFLDRLRGERSDSMVLPQGERVPGFGEVVLRVLDVPAALFRVLYAGLGFFDDSLEDPLPSLVERSDGDSPKQAFRRYEFVPAREGPGLLDIPLERQRFNAGLLRPIEDRVRIGERIRDPRLSPRNLEDPPRGTRKIQSPSEVPGGLRLLRPLEEAPRERRVGRIAARGHEVPPGRRDRPFRDVGGRPRGQAPIERLPADVAGGPTVRYVRLAEGAAGHVAPTEGSPSATGGMTPLDVGSAGINEASSISHLITVWPGPVPRPFPKSFSSRAVFGRRRRSREGRTGRCLVLAARRGRSLVGMAVVDGDGIEVGYVSGEETNTLVLGEGSGGRMRLGRRYVSGVADRVTLRGPAAEIFAGLNVVDSDGEFVGIVRDTNEADDVLDSFIVEDESGEMVNVLLEDVRSIDEWVELSVAGDTLYEKS